MFSSVEGLREACDRICSCPNASLPQCAQARSMNGDEAVCEQFFCAQEEFEPPSEDLATHAQQLREMQEKLEIVQNQLVELRQEVRRTRIETQTALPVEADVADQKRQVEAPYEDALAGSGIIKAATAEQQPEAELQAVSQQAVTFWQQRLQSLTSSSKIAQVGGQVYKMLPGALMAKQQQLNQDNNKQEEERLLVALAQSMGFYKGKPLAALVVFRCCLQWRAIQADRTSVFKRIIQVIGNQIEQQQHDNACLAYWLTNTVTLLYLLQRNIMPASGSGASVKHVAAAAGCSIMGGLLGRQPMGGEQSTQGGGAGGFRPVEAKYPALLFKQQLDAFVQKIFPMMRDNVKKTITPMLGHCIIGRAHDRGAAASSRLNNGAVAPNAGSGAAAQSQALSDILHVFDDLLVKLRDNHVPKPLVQALFKQLFSFVNMQLFNWLLLKRECCSFSNGEFVKTGLAQVECWTMEHGTEWVGKSWDELKYIRQAVTFLVIGNKPKKTLDDITRDLCPVLSIQQLYRISTMYWDDKYNTEKVSSEVLERMLQAMVENNSSASDSLLLDDDSTLPFAANDILAQMDDKDLYVGLPVPEPLKQVSNGAASFAFLQEGTHVQLV